MKRQHWIGILSMTLGTGLSIGLPAFIFLGLAACVSMHLPTSSSKKAKSVEYGAPPPPFKEISAEQFDKVWLSGKTGNTISYLSECENALDPSLKQIEADSLAALGNLKIESSVNANFNHRESLLTTASGDVDGVPAKMKLIIFKRNNCNYTLSYAGVAKKFAEELANFERFVESFKVP